MNYEETHSHFENSTFQKKKKKNLGDLKTPSTLAQNIDKSPGFLQDQWLF